MNRLIRNIPNSITCLNIAAGFMAILMAMHGADSLWGLPAYQWSWIFIGIAAVADFLDGFAARMLKAYSDLGKELDSLCDLVSFGVAPAILMYQILDIVQPIEWLKWTVILIPVSAALRLARFNIDTRQTTSFIGMPVPANAIFWIGISSLCISGTEFVYSWYCFLAMLLFECWLMNSPVKFFSLKFKGWGWKKNMWRWIMIVTAVLLVAIMGVSGMAWVIVVYLFYSLVGKSAA